VNKKVVRENFLFEKGRKAPTSSVLLNGRFCLGRRSLQRLGPAAGAKRPTKGEFVIGGGKEE